MKATMMKSISLVCLAGLLCGPAFATSRSNTPLLSITAVQQTDQARSELKEGRRLLKRGRADQALIRLQNALNLYTAAKDLQGSAATQNELGDLYLRQGQYTV